jgi:hypothetical protein
MWFSKVTSLGDVCNTTTSFDDEPCGRQKEGLCPRVVESDRDVTCSEHFGGTGKNTTEIVYEFFFHEPNFFL